MSDLHLSSWPAHAPRHLFVPETSLWHNALVSAARFPDKPFLIFYDTVITYGRFRAECERMAPAFALADATG